ncbi:MAG: substrate-binding domain-containing protein, partial [Actinobacteria bacterium]|nr:substrate-binding domain-containing protein [Actinomycetota bacterium]
AMRAAKDFGADVTIIYKGGDTAGQVAAIEAAIEAKPNGLAITIPDPVAFDEVTQKALDAGIPVIAFNIDGGKDNPRLAYIGADLTVDGYLLGLEMQQYFKKGDHVLIPAEFPGMYYAMARSAGVIKAMDAIGVTTEILDAGGMDAATTTSRIAAYMQGHPETKGIISVGGLTTDSSVIVVEDLGLQDKVVVGGSDIVTNTLRGLQNGIVKATIDQQLFLQTYYTIAELVMYNWGAFAPASINTSVGIVTPKDVDKLVPLINAQIR